MNKIKFNNRIMQNHKINNKIVKIIWVKIKINLINSKSKTQETQLPKVGRKE